MPIVQKTLSEIETTIRAGTLEALIVELRGGDAADQLLARALHCEQAALCAMPELALPTLHRICLGHEALQPMLAAWEMEWKQGGRGPWLRALTPQHWGLQSALVRRFSVEETLWTRPRYQAEKSWRDAHLTIVDTQTDRSCKVPCPNDDRLSYAAILDENSILVSGWYLDDDGVIARIDLTKQQITWRTTLTSQIHTVLIVSNEQLLVADSKGFGCLLQQADGIVVRWFRLPRGNYQLSKNRDELFVTTGEVCRSFTLRDLLTIKYPSDAHEVGFTNAEFSSDGELLVCGLTMFNARTGQRIAELEADSGGYLEGGPPRRARRVMPNGFIETRPGRGTKRWNRNGECKDIALERFSQSHTVVFGDDGRHVATQYFSGLVELREVDSNVVKATSYYAATSDFEWVGDQNAVAYMTDEGCVRIVSLDGTDHVISDRPGTQQLLVSHDSQMLAAIGDATATIWSLHGAPRLVGEVPLSATQPHGLAEFLHGQHGFRIRKHPWRGEYQAGWFKVIDENTGAIIAEVPSEGPLRADPTGTRWASRTELFALEL